MDYQQILYDLRDGVLTLTLHRPERMNAFTGRMLEELLHALDRADEDDTVRAVIVTGSGRAFCAGADLSGGGETFSRTEGEQAAQTHRDRTHRARTHRDGGGRLTLRLFECTKPVIAAINGAAVGIGATMILAMDIRLAADSARFGFVFTRRGIVPEACSSWFLPRLVGMGQAMEWVSTGRIFGAQEALAGRLVNRVLPDSELLPAAEALGREIAENTSAVSVALSRQLMWRMLGADHPMEAHKLDSRVIHYMGASPDAREGVTSFLEKRPASFTMRPSTDMPDFYPWWTPRPFNDSAE